MSFKALIKHVQHVTEKPRVFTNERYDMWLNFYLDDPNDPRIPKNIKTRIEAYLKLRGDGPYPEPQDIKDWFCAWGENKFFVDRFAGLGTDGDFCDDFNTDFY